MTLLVFGEGAGATDGLVGAAIHSHRAVVPPTHAVAERLGEDDGVTGVRPGDSHHLSILVAKGDLPRRMNFALRLHIDQESGGNPGLPGCPVLPPLAALP